LFDVWKYTLKNYATSCCKFFRTMKIWPSNFSMVIINKLIGLSHLVWWGL